MVGTPAFLRGPRVNELACLSQCKEGLQKKISFASTQVLILSRLSLPPASSPHADKVSSMHMQSTHTARHMRTYRVRSATVYSGDKPDGSGPRSWYEMRIPHSGSDRFRPSPLTSGTPTVTDAFKKCQLQPPFSEPERRRTRSASLANLERSSCCACLPVGPRAGDLRIARYGGRTVALSVARSGLR